MSNSDVVIRVEGLGKKYSIHHEKSERYTLRDVVARQAKAAGRLLNPFTLAGQLRKAQRDPAAERAVIEEDFWALKDVSFEIRQGERVGIIGRNGAGKSTLLKILSRITEPTMGRVEIRGRVASLLEVGTGFHPELTGRENIYLNGAILGMTQREIRARFDEIVAFAEVERFLDTPVKRYSSGMYVRLAFAVAAHLEPEILVVDEVLAVGDACFQRKCLGKMEDVADKEGRTVLFVSHNMTAVSSLCSSAKLLSNGRLVQEGLPAEVVNTYLDLTYVEKHQVWEGPPIGDNIAKVRRASVSQNGRITLNSHEPIQIELEIEIRKSIYGLIVGWEVWSQQEELLAYTLWDDIQDPPGIVTDIGIYRIGLEIPANTFAAGSYVASLDLGIHNQRRIIPAKVISLHLMIENTLGIGRRYPVSVNALRPEWHWKVLPISESHQFSENQKRIESDD